MKRHLQRVSERSEVEPFYVMEVLKAAAERQRTHGDVLILCAGQPSTPAPAAAREAAVAALQDGEVMGYTESTGLLPLRQAIATHHRETAGIEVHSDDVVVFPGSSGAFTALFLAAFDPGDTVAMTRPGYPAYRNTLQALGCRVLELDCRAETRYQPTVAMLEALDEPPAELTCTDGCALPERALLVSTLVSGELLEQIARERQIFFFTCHPSMARLLVARGATHWRLESA